MTTLLEKRQASALKSLLNRKEKAETYIQQQQAKLDEKIAPYKQELEIVNRMIDEHKAANPQLPIDGEESADA